MANDDHPPAFLLYAQDFVSDSKVEAMTTREVGAYFLLLCKAWHETPVGTIPNNDRVLARWARLTPDEWAECRDAVLSPFRACTDNRLLSPRLSSEYRKLMESRRKKSIAGKAGAERRWQRHGDVIPDAWQCHDSANAEAMPKDAISISKIINNSLSSAPARDSEEKEETTPGPEPPEEIPESLLVVAETVISPTPIGQVRLLLLDGHPADWIEDALKEAGYRDIKGKRAVDYARKILQAWRTGGKPKDNERKPYARNQCPARREAADFSGVRTGEAL